MFFRKEKKDDISEIKNAVMSDDLHEVDDFLKPAPREIQRESGAPLFVKVEKYREVLTRVQEMKIFVSGVKQLFNVLSEIESVRADALKIFKVTVQRLENSIAEIDSELLKPRGLDLGDVSYGETEVRHIEGSLSDLQKQLMDLRRELQEMK